MSDKIYRPLVLILLVVLILVVSVGAFLALLDRTENTTRAKTCNQSIASADFVGMMADYQKAVYNNPDTTTIYQQTFLANEYQLNAISLQTMVMADCLP
jgi:hypothetical protein